MSLCETNILRKLPNRIQKLRDRFRTGILINLTALLLIVESHEYLSFATCKASCAKSIIFVSLCSEYFKNQLYEQGKT